MKKILLLVLSATMIFVGSHAFAYSNRREIKIKKIPTTLAGFLALRDKLAKTPAGGAAVFVTAMVIYTKNQKLGMQCFTIALDRSRLRRGKIYKGFAPRRSLSYHFRRLLRQPYIPFAYIQGTSSLSGYKLPDAPYSILFTQHRYQRNSVLIGTTSGNMPRPISLRKNNRGIWKVVGASSLFVGLRKIPVKKIDDDL